MLYKFLQLNVAFIGVLPNPNYIQLLQPAGRHLVYCRVTWSMFTFLFFRSPDGESVGCIEFRNNSVYTINLLRQTTRSTKCAEKGRLNSGNFCFRYIVRHQRSNKFHQ